MDRSPCSSCRWREDHPTLGTSCNHPQYPLVRVVVEPQFAAQIALWPKRFEPSVVLHCNGQTKPR